MSVLLVLSKNKNIPLAVPWALVFAKAKKCPLKILWTQKAANKGEPKKVGFEEVDESQTIFYGVKKYFHENPDPSIHLLGSSSEEDSLKEHEEKTSVSLYTREHPDILASSLGFIHGEDVDLVMVLRDPNDIGEQFVRSILLAAQPPVILLNALRPPPSSKVNIVTPVSGGEHVTRALKLARDVASLYSEKFTAFHVEPEGGEDAELVGLRQVRKHISQAKMSLDEVHPSVVIHDKVTPGILMQCEKEDYDLLLLGSSQESLVRRVLFGDIASEVLKKAGAKQNIAMLRGPLPMMAVTKKFFDKYLARYFPQLDREARVTLFEGLQSGSHWSLDFIVLIVLSSVIASLGLIQNSPAIVIGAMLVAPLMTPMIGAGLSLVQGNVRLMKNAGKSIGFGFLLSLSVGYLAGLFTPMESLSSEILARGAPNLLDLFVAGFSGMAAAYAVARPGLSGALPGVAIAAALVPPITSAGIALSLSEFAVAEGAASLFGTNLLAIVVFAAVTMYGVGARPDKKFSGTRVWARRTFVGLSLGVFLIALPLAFGFLGTMRTQNVFGKAIARSLPASSSLKLDHYSYDKGTFYIALMGPKPLDKETFLVMQNKLEGYLQPGQKIEVSSRLTFSGEKKKAEKAAKGEK